MVCKTFTMVFGAPATFGLLTTWVLYSTHYQDNEEFSLTQPSWPDQSSSRHVHLYVVCPFPMILILSLYSKVFRCEIRLIINIWYRLELAHHYIFLFTHWLFLFSCWNCNTKSLLFIMYDWSGTVLLDCTRLHCRDLHSTAGFIHTLHPTALFILCTRLRWFNMKLNAGFSHALHYTALYCTEQSCNNQFCLSVL